MSFGATQFFKNDESDVVFNRCDKALYQAKDQGRNQTVLAAFDEQSEND